MNRLPVSAKVVEEELQLATLRAVADSPSTSQRGLAAALGLSLGKTNFLLRALLEKGLLKAENFRRSDNRLAYLYVLTPSGLKAKAHLTAQYLERKEREYLQLQAEIARLRHETRMAE
jgi:EPS-associated MarR family transcriptional regulator